MVFFFHPTFIQGSRAQYHIVSNHSVVVIRLFLFFREWLREDCCDYGEEECNKEEREEYRVESKARSYVADALCELSIKE